MEQSAASPTTANGSNNNKAADDGVRRSVAVVPPEQQNGNIEYKRLVSNSASRLRGLTTQMSFRLDEGQGYALYRIGVEDNGCHSLLSFESIAESARILECIARSLNAVVTERAWIVDEITTATADDGDEQPRWTGRSTRIPEPPVWRTEHHQHEHHQHHPHDDVDFDTHNDDEAAAAAAATSLEENHHSTDQNHNWRRTRITDGYVRGDLTIHRVETHMLDAVPVNLHAIAADATEMMRLGPPTTSLYNSNHNTHPANLNNHNNHGDSTAAASSDAQTTATNGGHHHHSSHKSEHHASSSSSSSSEHLSVGETLSARNVRVAVVGNVDAGKSTLIGTLTTSNLDDGRGRSRTAIMKHRHEIESGRTSTVSTHLMGFKSTGEPITGKDHLRNIKRRSEDEIARESYRVITLMDLAGHEKYLKTTIHGVSSGFADHSLIMVNARQPPTHMTQHHLNLCCSFGIPVIVVFTKIDHCPDHAYQNCKEQVMKMLRSPEVGKQPYMVRNEDDVAVAVDKLHRLAPMINTSCVTGQGIDLLQQLLFSLPKRRRHETKVNRSFEFLVEDIFNVPGVGAVVSGFVNAGELTVGGNAHVFVGPTDDGTFLKTIAKSAHIARINTSHITSGQSACLALSLSKDLRKKLRRGMVVLQENPTSTRHFDAEICVLKGEGTTIRRSYQAYVHILNVRQSAYARSIELVQNVGGGSSITTGTTMTSSEERDGIVLRPGSRAKVTFEFAKRPEYIRPGMRMLFRDGRVRGVGIITGIPTVAAAS